MPVLVDHVEQVTVDHYAVIVQIFLEFQQPLAPYPLDDVKFAEVAVAVYVYAREFRQAFTIVISARRENKGLVEHFPVHPVDLAVVVYIGAVDLDSGELFIHDLLYDIHVCLGKQFVAVDIILRLVDHYIVHKDYILLVDFPVAVYVAP